MYKYLFDIIKKMEGNVIGLGLDDKLLYEFSKNNKVNVYTIERSNKKFGNGLIKSKKRRTSSGKSINIKKLYKYFKKNSVDYIICNLEEVNDYLKYFIRDTIYLDKNNIYLYGNMDIDMELIKKRYQRYNAVVDIKKYKNGVLLTIDSSKANRNWFMDKMYFISDTFYNLIDFISNVLVS